MSLLVVFAFLEMLLLNIEILYEVLILVYFVLHIPSNKFVQMTMKTCVGEYHHVLVKIYFCIFHYPNCPACA